MTATRQLTLVVVALFAACAHDPVTSAPVLIKPMAGLGALQGQVVDAATGEPVMMATIVVTSPVIQGSQSEFTDADGRFAFRDLPAGTYDILVVWGDLKLNRRGLSVVTGQSRVADFKLELGKSGEAIRITEKAPTINPGSTKQGLTLAPDGANMPPRGRTFHGVLESAAGSQGDNYGTSFSGSTSVENNHVVDGINTTGGGKAAREWIQSQPTDELWVIARAGATASAAPAADGLGSGLLRVTSGPPDLDQNREVLLPLESTDVRARILGYIASVDVKQRFSNPYKVKIDVEYLFPLPANAAVADFIMTVGTRRIRGIVRDRAEAQEIYDEARRAGHVASLLTEERPNIFAQHLANLEPQRAIDIELTYFNTLPLEDGAFTFAFPMVVGPRYNPKGTANAAPAVTYLKPDQRSRHRLSLSVELDGGAPLASVSSPTHLVDVAVSSDRARRVTLSQGAVLPNKDFVLRYALAGKTLHPTFFHDGDTFAFVLQPPSDLSQLARAPMEMVFVLDCSGSMAGAPLDAAKRTVRRVLDRLGPDDTFQIITFSESVSALGKQPVAATPENLARGRRWLEQLESEGGTEMLQGIRAALDYPHEGNRLRLVTFLTDGYIGNENEVLAEIDRRLGTTRIFSFGVGTSVNRFLLERMAVFGRGAVAFVGLGDKAEDEAAVADFYERMSHPALADVSVDWNGMEVAQVFPSRIPDLVVGRPVVVTGKLRGKPAAEIRIRGNAGGRPISVRVPIERTTPHPALVKVWARAGIGDLADKAIVAADARPYAAQIKDVALRNGLVSPFTSFVAVDAATRTAGGPATVVPVAVPVPAGVRYDRTVGGE